jgi:hypothetical protein
METDPFHFDFQQSDVVTGAKALNGKRIDPP